MTNSIGEVRDKSSADFAKIHKVIWLVSLMIDVCQSHCNFREVVTMKKTMVR